MAFVLLPRISFLLSSPVCRPVLSRRVIRSDFTLRHPVIIKTSTYPKLVNHVIVLVLKAQIVTTRKV